uniref:Uncharacterized protein n=1 Tax=Arundo donax TaxID=35708 RepID=A0A0A9GD68_ARUDO
MGQMKDCTDSRGTYCQRRRHHQTDHSLSVTVN